MRVVYGEACTVLEDINVAGSVGRRRGRCGDCRQQGREDDDE